MDTEKTVTMTVTRSLATVSGGKKKTETVTARLAYRTRAAAVTLCLLIAVMSAKAQNIIVQTDPALSGAVTAQTTTVNTQLKAHNATQAAILATDAFIEMTLDSIHKYEQIVYDYLSEASSIVKSAVEIKTCADLTMKIFANVGNLAEAVKDHPQGALVSAVVNSHKDEVKIEVLGLATYIGDLVTKGGAQNLLNSYERMKILTNIRNRLFRLNDALYWLRMEVETLRLSSLPGYLFPEEYYLFMGIESKYNETVRDMKRLLGSF